MSTSVQCYQLLKEYLVLGRVSHDLLFSQDWNLFCIHGEYSIIRYYMLITAMAEDKEKCFYMKTNNYNQCSNSRHQNKA